jgi:hypothetical protein
MRVFHRKMPEHECHVIAMQLPQLPDGGFNGTTDGTFEVTILDHDDPGMFGPSAVIDIRYRERQRG